MFLSCRGDMYSFKDAPGKWNNSVLHHKVLLRDLMFDQEEKLISLSQ